MTYEQVRLQDELVDALANLAWAYRELGGLEVAWDAALVRAEHVLESVKDSE